MHLLSSTMNDGPEPTRLRAFVGHQLMHRLHSPHIDALATKPAI